MKIHKIAKEFVSINLFLQEAIDARDVITEKKIDNFSILNKHMKI